MQYRGIKKEEWDKLLESLILSHNIFASVRNEFGQDYELIRLVDIPSISYNIPKPATALKSFFLPVKENVTTERPSEKPRIIIGIPNCDIEGLSLLDEIYLDEVFPDIHYRMSRNNTLLISADCFGIQEHCHCMTYDIKPYASRNADITVMKIEEDMVFGIISPKGEEFMNKIAGAKPVNNKEILSLIEKKHISTEALLEAANKELPDYKKTGRLVSESEKDIWEKYSRHCVSCGACTTACPTCTCFLLIDKPDFEKIKQMDTCQYPGFERVAGGEDALFSLHFRFKNRYMCKYVWKPQKFKSLACTGCGRCIEGCIGKINKNEIFMELQNDKNA